MSDNESEAEKETSKESDSPKKSPYEPSGIKARKVEDSDDLN